MKSIFTGIATLLIIITYVGAFSFTCIYCRRKNLMAHRVGNPIEGRCVIKYKCRCGFPTKERCPAVNAKSSTYACKFCDKLNSFNDCPQEGSHETIKDCDHPPF